MQYGESTGGVIVPDRLADKGRVTQKRRDMPQSYRTREYHPDNEASYGRRPDPAYLEELHKIDPNLGITWNPLLELWQVWVRDSMVGLTDATAYCKGWRLLFTLREADTREYAPLDNRLFALLYAHDTSRFGGAIGYYNEMKRRQDEQKASLEKEKFHLSQETARGLWDHGRPMVGYGPSGNGNKVR